MLAYTIISVKCKCIYFITFSFVLIFLSVEHPRREEVSRPNYQVVPVLTQLWDGCLLSHI